MGIIQAIAAIAILAAVSAGFLDLMGYMNSSMVRTQGIMNRVGFQQSLMSIISNPATCRNQLLAASATQSYVTSPATFTGIAPERPIRFLLPDGVSVAGSNQNLTSYGLKIDKFVLRNGTLIPGGTPAPNYLFVADLVLQTSTVGTTALTSFPGPERKIAIVNVIVDAAGNMQGCSGSATTTSCTTPGEVYSGGACQRLVDILGCTATANIVVVDAARPSGLNCVDLATLLSGVPLPTATPTATPTPSPQMYIVTAPGCTVGLVTASPTCTTNSCTYNPALSGGTIPPYSSSFNCAGACLGDPLMGTTYAPTTCPNALYP